MMKVYRDKKEFLAVAEEEFLTLDPEHRWIAFAKHANRMKINHYCRINPLNSPVEREERLWR